MTGTITYIASSERTNSPGCASRLVMSRIRDCIPSANTISARLIWMARATICCAVIEWLQSGGIAHDAADAEVAGRGVDGLRHARRRAIAPAVVGRAQVRAALHDPARDVHVGRAWIETLL